MPSMVLVRAPKSSTYPRALFLLGIGSTSSDQLLTSGFHDFPNRTTSPVVVMKGCKYLNDLAPSLVLCRFFNKDDALLSAMWLIPGSNRVLAACLAAVDSLAKPKTLDRIA